MSLEEKNINLHIAHITIFPHFWLKMYYSIIVEKKLY